MSNSSSNSVALQADVTSLPISVLRSIPSFLRAISDNVNASAVVQIEALGSCFHLNGEVAKRVPDLLKRSNSQLVERLQLLVGWIAGDTASYMAATSGGQTAAVLSWVLEGLYPHECGDILYELSSRLLTQQQRISSVSQFARVAQVLAHKIHPLGWGTHLAHHVTRIRKVYFDANLPIPRTLADEPSIESMTDFLDQLHTALEEEHTILHLEGCHGAAVFVAILMALCPEDVYVQVENEVIWRGRRHSVLVSISASGHSKIATELVLHDSSRYNIQPFPIVSARPWHSRIGRMKIEGCLADMLDRTFLKVGMECPQSIRTTCADLIVSLVLSATPPNQHGGFPRDGLHTLLGPFAKTRVREVLVKVLRTDIQETHLISQRMHPRRALHLPS
jgi:hypothetical protein